MYVHLFTWKLGSSDFSCVLAGGVQYPLVSAENRIGYWDGRDGGEAGTVQNDAGGCAAIAIDSIWEKSAAWDQDLNRK